MYIYFCEALHYYVCIPHITYFITVTIVHPDIFVFVPKRYTQLPIPFFVVSSLYKHRYTLHIPPIVLELRADS